MYFSRIVKLSTVALLMATAYTSIEAKSSQTEWQEVGKKAQNCVVQIVTQSTAFNWLSPYRSPETQESAGTGFFINSHGYILTNYHVVEQAKTLLVFVPILGRKPLEARIVGVCPDSDIALLTLTEESAAFLQQTLGKIPFLELGNSDEIDPSDPVPVLALGYPHGQRYLKSTVGVIAGREFLGDKSFFHMTAPINPGNSGGPCLNPEGKVIGINTAGVPGSQNIGYIVAINDVSGMLDHLLKTRLYRKTKLMINYNHATNEHMSVLNNPVPGGVYINYIKKDSLADSIGIRVGDVLYEIIVNSEAYRIDEYGDVIVTWRGTEKISLHELLLRTLNGTPISFIIYRNGEKLVISCEFENPKLPSIRRIFPEYEPEEIDYEMFGGLVIMQLRINHFPMLMNNAMVSHYIHAAKQDYERLVITQILPGSEFHKINCFSEGDLIDKVNGIEVKNLIDLRKAVQESLNTGHIALSTKDHVATVISIDKILRDEPRLARDFGFSISKSMTHLEYERSIK